MSATVADIQAAQSGSRIAVVTRTHADARADIDRLAPFAGPDATIRRAQGRVAITYGRGSVQWISGLGWGLRGASFDRIHVAPEAANDDVVADARLALAAGGELFIGSTLTT